VSERELDLIFEIFDVSGDKAIGEDEILQVEKDATPSWMLKRFDLEGAQRGRRK
jgi:hypothetical protein